MTASSTMPVIPPPARPQQLPPDLQARLEEALVGSPNCVQLGPNPELAYTERMVGLDRSVAELFHVNSRLRRQGKENLPADPQVIRKVQRWYHEPAYRPDLADLDLHKARELGIRYPVDQLDGTPARLVRALGDLDLPQLTYAVDLWLVVNGRASRLPSQLDALWYEREFGPGDLEALRSALIGLPEFPDDNVIGFLAVTPWRYAMFQGPRGHRHALVEVGRVLAGLEQVTHHHGLLLAWTLDFIDGELERLLGLDGVERTVLAAFVAAGQQEGIA